VTGTPITEDDGAAGRSGGRGAHDPSAHGGLIAVPTPDARPHAKILTVSESVALGGADDRGGEAVAVALSGAGYAVLERRVSRDGVEPVATALRELCEGFAGLVVTTGGTGFGPTDLTPEATRAVIEREAPGLAEAIRLASPLGRLSRAIAGTRGEALVLNTPGSPSGAVEYLDAVIDVLPHALGLLAGENPHPHSPRPRGKL
jgi:molybdopterin adenylyltransferase